MGDVGGVPGKFFSVVPYKGTDGQQYFDMHVTDNHHIGHGVTSPEHAHEVLNEPGNDFHVAFSEKAKNVW